ncbi:phage minor head protein [Devosia sp.]|uniref:phage minor head protein n=1 Tax=Devosia sp. TaxID=1871048 RepID=UPI001AD29186|nr:phage minor head protein [Devosia sp.]MBN9332202.1 hypothetical protein [Devosia sp.]
MARLSKKLEEKRAELARLIERKAFDAYVRYGAVPDDFHRLAETAADGQKFLDLCAGLSTKALPEGRPTTHYTWRTAGDDRVRHAHAALEGRVFAWTNAPSEGHPGTAPYCRCWAEPYYGNPALPDASLQLGSERQVATDPSELWASVETLTRPDGSIAASEVIMTDGASVRSTFAGQSVSQVVVMPNATFLEAHRNAQGEHISLGRDGEVLARVAWLRSALTRGPLVAPPAVLAMPKPPAVPSDALADTWLASPFAIMVRGALTLYNAAVAQPGPMGIGDTGLVALAFKVWDGSRTGNSVTVTQVALTAEQVAQTCKLLPEVQALTNEAAAKMSAMRLTATPQNFGIAVHTEVHRQITMRKLLSPVQYGNVHPEMSITGGGLTSIDGDVYYGQAETSRLDVYERVNATTACIYDVKTGRRGLSLTRTTDLVSRTTKIPGVTNVIVLQVGIQ